MLGIIENSSEMSNKLKTDIQSRLTPAGLEGVVQLLLKGCEIGCIDENDVFEIITHIKHDKDIVFGELGIEHLWSAENKLKVFLVGEEYTCEKQLFITYLSGMSA